MTKVKGKKVMDDAARVRQKLTQGMLVLHFPIAVHLFQNKKNDYLRFKDIVRTVLSFCQP